MTDRSDSGANAAQPSPTSVPAAAEALVRTNSIGEERMGGSQAARRHQAAYSKFRLFTADEILDLPPVEWLIEGLLSIGALGVLYGQSGGGKTFVALDWALSVATGQAWLGRTVQSGPVVYVAAEGRAGVGSRVAAWKQHFGIERIERGRFILEPVQLRERSDLDLLKAKIDGANLQPALIVFDTFARCFVGGDENTSKEMGQFLDACRRLQDETHAAVLLVHHTGKTGEQERGSSAMRAAADAMFKVSKTSEGRVMIRNDKQKEDESCDAISAQLHRLVLGRGLGAESSCVLVSCGSNNTTTALSQPHADALTALRNCPEGTATLSEWEHRYAQEFGGAPGTTFRRWRDTLLTRNLIVAIEGGRGRDRFRAVADGVQLQSATTANGAPSTLRGAVPYSDSPPPPPPRRGGGSARGGE
jgi:hypothetical protein